MADISFGGLSRRSTWGGEQLLTLALAVWIVAISLWPLGRLFLEALAPGQDGAPLGLMAEVVAARSTARAFYNTLTASGGAVVISCILGLSLALLTGAFTLRGRVAMTFLILSPLLIPSQTMALAWIELTGSSSPILAPLGLAPSPGTTNPIYSGGGVALLMGIEHMPLVFIASRAALLSIPGDLIEAARMSGASQTRIFTRIILPLLAPATAAGAVLAFSAAVGNFGVPALLGIPGRFPMLTTQIYQRLNGFGPTVAGQVAVLALILVLLAVGALAIRALILRYLSVPMASGARMASFALGRAQSAVEAAVWMILFVIAIAPMLALIATALSPALGVPLSPATISLKNFADVLANPAAQRAIVTSLQLSVACALICAAIALPFAFLARHVRARSIRVLDWLVDAPWVVPGTVLALAMILAFLRPLPVIGSLYGTFALLLLAYLARFLPLILRPVMASAEAQETSLDEAARIVGAGIGKRITHILGPSVLPALAAGALLLIMTAVNELTLSALLWSSGNETIGVMIFSLQYEGNSTQAAAMAVISVAIVLAMALALDRLHRRLPQGTLPWRS